ncbi:hypothetical protein EX30DRAFT_385692 [Ascodesmis nigricans]|uniref:Uncharacterized protein n=1 Tax=Ascodesmis nigricans TaxID=341454 RepID=A0A4S2MM07_9PEZI|nr:hypothetical protein EX30DRAFT_385692 [Ascodesmis nigricans]
MEAVKGSSFQFNPKLRGLDPPSTPMRGQSVPSSSCFSHFKTMKKKKRKEKKMVEQRNQTHWNGSNVSRERLAGQLSSGQVPILGVSYSHSIAIVFAIVIVITMHRNRTTDANASPFSSPMSPPPESSHLFQRMVVTVIFAVMLAFSLYPSLSTPLLWSHLSLILPLPHLSELHPSDPPNRPHPTPYINLTDMLFRSITAHLRLLTFAKIDPSSSIHPLSPTLIFHSTHYPPHKYQTFNFNENHVTPILFPSIYTDI